MSWGGGAVEAVSAVDGMSAPGECQACAKLVPKPYRKLMCLTDSPIKGIYLDEFEVDMNGKR